MWLHDDDDGRATIIVMGFGFGYSGTLVPDTMIVLHSMVSSLTVTSSIVPRPRVYIYTVRSVLLVLALAVAPAVWLGIPFFLPSFLPSEWSLSLAPHSF
jgi:hypothetical protein